ncbi:MAG: SsrA-binding protein SmpB [Candidatus Tectomicrobia bacterium]|uniref:SsrA-binding protein n=1 Tax=Tectimicrobiota bacterium TaxID=2528274 RepID=A0A932GSS0_UNCTE|nr:SsrA-binding protein SmpB [Candidatus Tectomicrobia bacterium]
MAGEKIICTNRRAHHDYFIEEVFEAGLALKGTEVKSLREGKANLKDSYAEVVDGEVYLQHCHISPYSAGNQFNHEPLRSRKLLLHKREIKKLYGGATLKGYTLIPLRLFFVRGRAKVEIALARGKKQYDRREDVKRREADREVERAFRDRKKRE